MNCQHSNRIDDPVTVIPSILVVEAGRYDEGTSLSDRVFNSSSVGLPKPLSIIVQRCQRTLQLT